MKIPVACSVCMKKEEFGKSSPPLLLLGELRDSGAVFVTCPKGHSSAVIYNVRKHELLFTSGAMALLDGYVNEAVSSFVVALERVYEFYIRVICRKRKLTIDVFESTWKTLARQSERQFGAFCLLFALETGTSFSLPNSVPNFRNKVLHRGYIPSTQEVYDFAEKIFKKIRFVMEKLTETAENSIKEEDTAQFKRQLDDIPTEISRGSMATISMHSSEWKESEAFSKWLGRYRDLYQAMCSLLPNENKTV